MPPRLQQCHNFNENVRRCHEKHGKIGEQCVREELEEKKCIAQQLCAFEAQHFYDEKIIPLYSNPKPSWYKIILDHNAADDEKKWNVTNDKVSCSTMVEAFAKPENELILPEAITKEDRDFCRKVTHKLASCLARRQKV